MAVTINQDAVVAEPVSAGVSRQRLMTTASNKNTSVLLDRLLLAAGATHELKIASRMPAARWPSPKHTSPSCRRRSPAR